MVSINYTYVCKIFTITLKHDRLIRVSTPNGLTCQKLANLGSARNFYSGGRKFSSADHPKPIRPLTSYEVPLADQTYGRDKSLQFFLKTLSYIHGVYVTYKVPRKHPTPRMTGDESKDPNLQYQRDKYRRRNYLV